MLKTGFRKRNPNTKNMAEKTAEGRCTTCFGPPHTIRRPSKSKCLKCSKVGHKDKTCRSLSDKRVGEGNFSETHHDDAFYIGELTELAAVQGGAGDSRKAKVTLNGQRAEFKVNTGADVTLIPPNLYYELSLQSYKCKTSLLEI